MTLTENIERAASHLDFFLRHIPLTLNYYHESEVNNVQLFALGLFRAFFRLHSFLSIAFHLFFRYPDLGIRMPLTLPTLEGEYSNVLHGAQIIGVITA